MAQRVASHASGIACTSVASVASGAAKRASGTKMLSMVSAKACHGFSNGFLLDFFQIIEHQNASNILKLISFK